MNKQLHEDKPRVFGPYSPVRVVANMAFVSGQVGVEPLTGRLENDPTAQAAQALENMRSVLGTAGLTMDDVVEVTLFVTDMADFKAINDVYGQFFAEPYPARACVAVKELPRVGGDVPAKVEFTAIAVGQPT